MGRRKRRLGVDCAPLTCIIVTKQAYSPPGLTSASRLTASTAAAACSNAGRGAWGLPTRPLEMRRSQNGKNRLGECHVPRATCQVPHARCQMPRARCQSSALDTVLEG